MRRLSRTLFVLKALENGMQIGMTAVWLGCWLRFRNHL